MNSSTIHDCSMLVLEKMGFSKGNITVLESYKAVPFEIKRIYYLYDVPGGETRGGHAHRNLYQLLIAASGSFDVILDDGRNKITYRLNRPYQGLFLVPGIWRELNNFSSGSVCLVLASLVYEESDYLRNYDEFLRFKGFSL